jgi:hypothetical protein
MSEDRQLQINTILLVVDLVLTAVVAVVTTMRFRVRCGDVECSCKPKDEPRSPGSATYTPPISSVVVGSPAQQAEGSSP